MIHRDEPIVQGVGPWYLFAIFQNNEERTKKYFFLTRRTPLPPFAPLPPTPWAVPWFRRNRDWINAKPIPCIAREIYTWLGLVEKALCQQ